MLEIGDTLKEVYNCDHAVIIPGSGTYAMEAAARQFATGKKAIVLRNGFFSYRWTQIFESCGIPTDHLVLKAQAVDDSPKPQFAPPRRSAMSARARWNSCSMLAATFTF